MTGRNQHTREGWPKEAVLHVLFGAVLLLPVGCGQSDAPASPELLEKIKNAISSPSPEIHRNVKDMPVAVFGYGAKVTIGMKEPATIMGCVFISDPSDNLRFEGGADKTIYKGGRGAVVLEGNKVYLYHLTVTDQQLTGKK